MKEVLLPYVFICWLLVKFGIVKWTIANAIKMISVGCFIAITLFTASRYYAPFDMTDSSTVKAPHATLSPLVGQQIDKIHVEHNQFVKKGDLIYTLRSDRADSQMQNVVSQIDTLEKQREGVIHQLEAANITVDNDRVEYERLLGMKDNASRSARDNAKAKLDAGTANLSSLESQIKMIDSQIEGAEAQLISAEYDLGRTYITAPFDGQVGLIDVAEGTVMGNIHLYDTSKKFLEMRIPEQAYDYIQVGQFSEFQVNSYPGHIFRGKVHSKRSSTGEAFMNPTTQEQHVRQHVGNNKESNHRTIVIEFDEELNGKEIPLGSVGSGWVSADKPHSALGFIDIIGGGVVRLKAMKSYIKAL